jgi:hypothetical protein
MNKLGHRIGSHAGFVLLSLRGPEGSLRASRRALSFRSGTLGRGRAWLKEPPATETKGHPGRARDNLRIDSLECAESKVKMNTTCSKCKGDFVSIGTDLQTGRWSGRCRQCGNKTDHGEVGTQSADLSQHGTCVMSVRLSPGLSDEERAVCSALSISEEEYANHK